MSSKKSMHIPHDLQLFSDATALICLSHDRAKVYGAKEGSLREIAFWHTKETDYKYSDREGFSHGEGPSSAFFRPGTEEHNKEHYIRVFFNYFSEQLKVLEEKFHFRDIYLFVPEDIKNLALEKMHATVKDKIHLIAGNLMHEHPLELLKRIEKSS